MSNRLKQVAAALVVAAGAAVSMAGGVAAPGTGLALLRAEFPGVRTAEEGGRITTVYGKPMTGGQTPEKAVSAWLKQHGDVFGVGPLDLKLRYSCEGGQGAITGFSYTQYVGGIPVEESIAKIVVQNGDGNHVVYAAGRLSKAPEGGFAPMTVTAGQALGIVKKMPEYAGMEKWSDGELVAYQGSVETGRLPLTRAWKLRGDSNIAKANRKGYTFFVDAATGVLLDVRDEILYDDVSGRVTGKASPGLKPDENGNPPADMPIDSILVKITGGGTAYTGPDGSYTISNGGNQQVTVTTRLDDGHWVDVNNVAGGVLSLSQMVTPPGPADFLFNSSPTQFNTAQVNAFIHQSQTHDYIKDRAPGFNGLDVKFPANVNIADSCNAYYDGNSTNFYQALGGCANTAYTTVISHEYGHHICQLIVNQQDAFGEGYGDTTAIMIYDTGIMGEDFCGPGCAVRNIDAANKQYPCNGEIHDCGQVIAGVWRDISLEFKGTYGSELGLELAQQLEVDWSIDYATGNVDGGQSAGPTTAIQVFTADDDDGNLDNGVPDYADLKAAFNKHGIDVPEIKLLAFTYPDGLPSQVVPGQETQFHVNVSGISEQPLPGTGQLSFRFGNDNFTVVSMTQLQDNQYLATLPAADCLETVDYFVLAKTTKGNTAFDPAGAPQEFREAIAFAGTEGLVSDAFESDTGWVSGAPGDTATTGKWNRMDPFDNGAQPGSDHSANGVNCWVTDGASGQLGLNDVDNGKTTLVSPVFDLSGAEDAFISYYRWYSNDTGATPNTDVFRVDVSNDDGQTWKNAETVGPGGAETHAGWFFHQFTLGEFVAPTDKVKIRFIAEDAGEGSLVEAAVDDFAIDGVLCGDACYADFDGNGTLDLFDFLAYVNAFNAEDPSADCDGNGGFDFFDFLCFTNEFNAGC